MTAQLDLFATLGAPSTAAAPAALPGRPSRRAALRTRPSLTALAGALFVLPVAAHGAPSFEITSQEISSFFHRSFNFGGEGLAGAAWLDYNQDGRLDLFLTNGVDRPNALFRNDGDGGFTDVGRAAGVADEEGHSGVVAGDIDNDGWTDLFVLGEGHCFGIGQSPARLYRNNGDGTFREIASAAGIDHADPAWSAAFGDIDNDGDLDLFVTGTGNLCSGVTNANRLYRNNGNLTFTEIGAAAGVASDLGACAAGFTDFDRDGWTDLFVGNCNGFSAPFEVVPTPAELFRNNGDLTFTEVGAQAGLERLGFWMSAAFGDYDRDGDIDVFCTNAGNGMQPPAPHALFRNEGNGRFAEVAAEAGVADFEFGWGATFADFDADADLDLFFTGSFPPLGFIGELGNPGRLLLNDGQGRFTDRTDFVPLDLSFAYTSGVAQADYDGDGFPDLVIQRDSYEHNLPGNPVLLRSPGSPNRHWLTVQLVGRVSNRAGIGARIEVLTPRHRQVREVQAGSSFASSETPWPTFGLDDQRQAAVRVTWPSGLRELFPAVSADQMAVLVEGEGVREPR